MHAVAQLAQQGVSALPKDNDAFFENWLAQLPLWIAEGREPYLFIHTPGNEAAPELAIRLYQKLRSQIAAHIQLAELRLLDKKPEETSTQMGLSW
ncbi:hypothetical protein DIKCMJMK_01896 [Shewanella oneidensis]|nr:hypothetical protein [Shewanella oneidensis]